MFEDYKKDHKKNQKNETQNKQITVFKLFWKVHSQSCIKCILMSKEKYGPLLQLLIFYDAYDNVVKNQLPTVCDRFKKDCILWYGEERLKEGILPPRTKLIRSISYIQKYLSNLDNKIEKIWIITPSGKLSEIEQKIIAKLKNKNREIIVKVISEQNGIIDTEKIETVLEEISSLQDENSFPNFSRLQSEKQRINQESFWMYSVFGRQNYEQAYRDFIAYLACLEQNATKNNRNIIQQIKWQYEHSHKKMFRNSKQCIKQYTADNGFHRLINLSLKSFSDSKDLAYIRFPFRMLFLSIVQLFNSQRELQKRKNGFVCYRGCNLSKQQIANLQESVGKNIQMKGFLSTSTNQCTAQSFMEINDQKKGVKFIIQVPPTHLITNVLGCFAFIDELSEFQFQKQVIFNPLNFFRLKSVKKNENIFLINMQYPINSQELQKYNTMNAKIKSGISLNKQEKQNYEILKNSVNFKKYQSHMFSVNRNQGEVLMRFNKYQALKFYEEKIILILERQKEKLKFIKGLIQHQYHTDQQLLEELYKQLRRTISFEWFLKEELNLLLLDNFVVNNKHLGLEIFFYYSMTLESIGAYERALIYQFILMKIFNQPELKIEIFRPLLWISLCNLAVSFIMLDNYLPGCQIIMYIFNIAKKSNFALTSFQFTCFLISLMANYMFDNYSKLSEYQKELISYIQQHESRPAQWIRITQNFHSITDVKHFYDFSKRTFGRPATFSPKFIIYLIQEQIYQLQVQYHNTQFNPKNCRQKIFNIKLALKCLIEVKLVQFEQFFKIVAVLCRTFEVMWEMKQAKNIENIVRTLCRWYFNSESVKNTKKYENGGECDMYYYQFKLHVVNIRNILKIYSIYKLLKLKQVSIQLYKITQICMTKFKNKANLHINVVIALCEYNLIIGNKQMCKKYIDFAQQLVSRTRNVMKVDRQHIILLKMKIKV